MPLDKNMGLLIQMGYKKETIKIYNHLTFDEFIDKMKEKARKSIVKVIRDP